MVVIDNSKTPGENGNTKHSPKESKIRNFLITLNNPLPEELETLKTLTSQLCTHYSWQVEEGASKTPHVQGAFVFRDSKPFSWWKNNFPRVHVEKIRNKKAALDYCCKPEGRLDGPYTKGLPCPIKTITEFSDWQLSVIKMIDNWSQGDRQIDWLWESLGKFGKSDLAKYLAVNYNCLILSGKSADIKNAVLKHKEENPANLDKLVIVFDVPRTNVDYVNYEALESLKNGLFYSGKYEGGMVIMNPPIVIVLANQFPKIEKLSKDRWKIINLRGEAEESDEIEVCVDDTDDEINLSDSIPSIPYIPKYV